MNVAVMEKALCVLRGAPLGIGVLPERGGTPLPGAWKPLALPLSC